jgi:hypothetical protein
MNSVQLYHSHFYELLKDNNISINDLPINLQQLITAYEFAQSSWDKENEGSKQNYIEALVTSDALISALVFQQSKKATHTEKISDAKLKELKIKALKLKYNLIQLKK